MPWYALVGSYVGVGALVGLGVEAFARLDALRNGDSYRRWDAFIIAAMFWPPWLIMVVSKTIGTTVLRVSAKPLRVLDRGLDSWATRKAAPELVRKALTGEE